MSDDDDSSEGWLTYKRLVLKVIEDHQAAINLIEQLTSGHTVQIESLQSRQSIDDATIAEMRSRLDTLSERMHSSSVTTAVSSGILESMWETKLGKAIFAAIALALVLFGAAAYNHVSDNQVDINRHIFVPHGTDGPEGATHAEEN